MKGPWESIAVGVERGYPTKKLERVQKPSYNKGVYIPPRPRCVLGNEAIVLNALERSYPDFSAFQKACKSTKFARELIREVIGLLPYEKHMMDQLKVRPLFPDDPIRLGWWQQHRKEIIQVR